MTNFENENAPIDFERLREVSADDAELINEILELYFSQTREMLGEIKSAISVKDAESVYKAAHKVLGSSMTCGMNAVVPAFKGLEEVGRSHDFENAETLLTQAEEGFKQLEIYLADNKQKFLS